MDNNNTIQQPTNKQGYQTLGKKVFWLFFLQTSPVAFVLLIISIILFVLSLQPFSPDTLMGNAQKYALGATLITFILSLLAGSIAFTVAWLTYKNYVFSTGEDSFKIKRGILSKTENAIPYRQIQNVDIERSIMFQMLGLSRLIILTAGHEDENPKGTAVGGDEAEGIIPAIDQKLADWLQTELLRRADIEKTFQVSNNNQSPKPL
jgi:uncharacterized membrane protein YdbT with pleckstrin-like domain